MNAFLRFPQANQLPDSEARLARESSRRLAALLENVPVVPLSVSDGHSQIELPVSAVRLLVDILMEMAEGHVVQLLPVRAELTTQQAADFLNVSRPYLIERLEAGAIPFRKVGTHRRVQTSDLLAYKQLMDATSRQAVAELTRISQELGLY